MRVHYIAFWIIAQLLCAQFAIAEVCDLDTYDQVVYYEYQTCYAVCEGGQIVVCENALNKVERVTMDCLENGDPNCPVQCVEIELVGWERRWCLGCIVYPGCPEWYKFTEDPAITCDTCGGDRHVILP